MINWEIVGVIIEIIGTITIIVTLIYILIQIRQNSNLIQKTIQSIRTQNQQSINENFNRWREMVLASNNAEIWIKGLNNLDELNRDEHIKFNMIAGSFIWTCWFLYQLQNNEGFLPDVNYTIFRDLYKHEGYRKWLLSNEKLHTDDFRDFLERVKISVGSERYEIGKSSSLTAGIY